MTYLICLSLPFSAHAKGKSRHLGRQPASGFQNLVAVTYKHGRTVRYEVKLKDGQYTVLMGTTTGERALQQLSNGDVDTLDETFRDLPTVEKIPPECTNSRVDITMVDARGASHKASCLGVYSITEPAYARFMKSLEAAF